MRAEELEEYSELMAFAEKLRFVSSGPILPPLGLSFLFLFKV